MAWYSRLGVCVWTVGARWNLLHIRPGGIVPYEKFRETRLIAGYQESKNTAKPVTSDVIHLWIAL